MKKRDYGYRKHPKTKMSMTSPLKSTVLTAVKAYPTFTAILKNHYD